MERVTIGDHGRVDVPEALMKELRLADGDVLTMEVVDGELRLRPELSALERIQRAVRRYNPEGRSMADELIAERRQEAARE